MNFINLLKIAINALKRNKMRTLLTMLGIVIGVASVIAMLAIGQGSKKSIQEQVSSMGSNMIIVFPSSQMRGGVQMGSASSKSLTIDDIEAISKNCPSVKMASPEVRGSGQVIYSGKNSPTTLYGGNENYLGIKKLSVTSGREFTIKEIQSSAKVCLAGTTVIENLFGSSADPIGQYIRFNSIPFKVIGVLSEKGQNTFGQDQDDLIIAPYTTVQKRVLAITHVQTILASALNEASSPKAVAEVEELLRARHKIRGDQENDFEVRSQEELVQTFSSISNILTILLGAIAGISLLVGGIGIMNIMYVSVTERTREIGLRMAIGGRGKDILLQFLTESILISVFGGLIGILLGVGASQLVGKIMNWPTVVLPQAVVAAFAVCTAIGIFFGWYPARKAANLDPIDALRYE
ncbi:MAG: ABC transporter permease [Bacteroidales bacterium]|nr:ABC transporter permease [Bacteroidales bacterium]